MSGLERLAVLNGLRDSLTPIRTPSLLVLAKQGERGLIGRACQDSQLDDTSAT